ncbi:hypothetical protein [Marinospirillum insulare]|uniref:Leucine rich repeat variant n=1 Tax=Marinospirillum insulare TaxID=217169 RepID=A0ABQ5ZXK8_9GAMM|nr:hypothetical protein [Marinospirillum insulare]GLR63067.1 hypothetical protein GCM10007878_05020 [Marinospirillum insulare]
MIDTQELQDLLVSKQHHEKRFALNMTARPETWHYIYNKHPELAFTLAQNPNLPEELANELASHPDTRVRLMIARYGQPGFNALKQLSEDKEAAIRLTIAKRQDLDEQLLSSLFEDKDTGVQLAAHLYQQVQEPLATAIGW